jgi:hypothetical protein
VVAAAADGLAVAPAVPVPPALLQAAAIKTAMTAPAPASHRPAAAARGPAWAARPFLVPPGTWPPINLQRIPGLLYAFGTTGTGVSGPPGFLQGP